MPQRKKYKRILYDNWYIVSHFDIDGCDVKRIYGSQNNDIYLYFNSTVNRSVNSTTVRVYGNHKHIYVELGENNNEVTIAVQKKLIREKIEEKLNDRN